ncbi:LysR family transcriptional regulator [Nocardiopsis sp. RSe5-2]|uniref:LysR family transcriptional regulator n=1 Tax=Nocardiopsis endophytica TaxID=3018445 RepID=A0ABT4U5H6_9ACTN|nr:LysR family transcriptional regulator [Nocardiopsis endophytica]MDA2812208.1 LysR family transcriptional regulator [Nocardiopsis endophytica]
MDVHTRLLRYFTAVAEEGGLTRAAERLYVSQPAVTKQIHRLEDLLGARLFDRTPTGMRLTAAGHALAGRAPALLAAWEEAARDVRLAADREARVLPVGFIASGGPASAVQAAFARVRPDWRIELRQAPWSDPTAGLADRRVRAALVLLPVPAREDLRVEVLYTEPRSVVLAVGHPLAEREVVRLEELEDEPFVAAPEHTGAWRDHWLAAGERTSRPRRVGAVAEHPDEWLNAIAAGLGVALAPESGARYYAHPGVVYRPLAGVSPVQAGVAWLPEADGDPVVADFVECCREAFGTPAP